MKYVLLFKDFYPEFWKPLQSGYLCNEMMLRHSGKKMYLPVVIEQRAEIPVKKY